MVIVPYGHINGTRGNSFLPFLPSQCTFRDLRKLKNPICDILDPFSIQVSRYRLAICLLKHAKTIDFTIKHYVCHNFNQKPGFIVKINVLYVETRLKNNRKFENLSIFRFSRFKKVNK